MGTVAKTGTSPQWHPDGRSEGHSFDFELHNRSELSDSLVFVVARRHYGGRWLPRPNGSAGHARISFGIEPTQKDIGRAEGPALSYQYWWSAGGRGLLVCPASLVMVS